MKKFKCILICCLIFILITGCANEEENIQGYAFHYCWKSYPYGSESSAVTVEKFSTAETLTPEQIITRYLEGPISDELRSPFPQGTVLDFLKINNDHTEIILSSEFAQLEKIDLTIACACLTLTINDLTNCPTVKIGASDSLLNNQKFIIMDANSLSLSDMVTAELSP